ncbi:unnamed protein product [Ranitomeya imitator]|uniref:P2X purinoreceptor 7 intracellular domain-containing protein n=1 Tax=Ranitomeya imitator TaxID=111125 RepID=A0ABN9KZ21_9NEOB|nr:unnamed protein product [Ranitomeya imitator]
MENINCIAEHDYFYTFCEREPMVNILVTTVRLDSHPPPQKMINRAHTHLCETMMSLAQQNPSLHSELRSGGLHGFLCIRNLRSECHQQHRVLPCETDSKLKVNFFCGKGIICNNYTTLFSSKKRKTAYRAFTAWIHGFLGKGNRRPIPSCVVKLVCEEFPEEHQEYMGFKLHYDNLAEFIFLE